MEKKQKEQEPNGTAHSPSPANPVSVFHPYRSMIPLAVETKAIFCYFELFVGQTMLFRKKSKTGDLVFAFFHLAVLVAILVYGLIGLARGNTWRFGVIIAGLGLYYLFVLHKSVREEIGRRKKRKESS